MLLCGMLNQASRGFNGYWCLMGNSFRDASFSIVPRVSAYV